MYLVLKNSLKIIIHASETLYSSKKTWPKINKQSLLKLVESAKKSFKLPKSTFTTFNLNVDREVLFFEVSLEDIFSFMSNF